MTGFSIRYKPPGPVAARFMASMSFLNAIMGPFGSGKTSACLLRPLLRIRLQPPSPIDGFRYWKHAVIRDTYRNLEQTVIPSWFNWIPKASGKWNGEPPMSHHLRGQLPGTGIKFDIEYRFIALGDNRIEDVMRGWEGSSANISEADRMLPEVLEYVSGRIPRYPPKAHGGCAHPFVDMDFNAPDDENWLYGPCIDNPPEDFAFFRQPSGFSAKAENLDNLEANFYDNLARGKSDWWIRRFIRNEFGYSREGKPIYPEFNDSLHVARDDLKPVPGIPLIIGMDAGLTPAAIIMQRLPNGQWRWLDEIATEVGAGMGPTRFGEELNRLISERYAGFSRSPVDADRYHDQSPIYGVSDPSAQYGADKRKGERNWIEIVGNVTRIRNRPAPTNDPTVRIEALRKPLTRMIDGQHPGLLISPRCKVARKGFNSGYRHRRKQKIGVEEYEEKVEKNRWSHTMEAGQYGVLGGGDYDSVMARDENRQRGRAQTAAITMDNPEGEWRGGAHAGRPTRAITE